MAFLIDGYNLLHVTGIFGQGAKGGSLKRSRTALLNFLIVSLEPEEVSRTTVVFDAHHAPSGLQRSVDHGGLTVRYAAGYDDADSLIEELIQADSAPRRLTVVSSDHRIQRAARRRRAKAVDSQIWYAQRMQLQRGRDNTEASAETKPSVPLSQRDVEAWLDEFAEVNLEQIRKELFSKPTSDQDPRENDPNEDLDAGNPFPPGYGEDLLEEDDP